MERSRKLRKGNLLLLIGGVAILVLILFFVFVDSEVEEQKVSEVSENEVCFDNKCFEVEIVDTPETRARGLMDREYLDADSGMLFVFERSDGYAFWMKDTLIALDIIWIGDDMKVVHIEENLQPCQSDPCESYFPNGISKNILEVNSGIVEKYGIEVGAEVILP